MSVESMWKIGAITAIVGAFVIRGIVEVFTGQRLHPAVVVFVIYPAMVVIAWLGWSLCLGLRALAGPSGERLRRLRLFETDLGLLAGWVAERDARPVAILSNPSMGEMFWHWYDVEVTASDPTERFHLLRSQEAWSGLRYRSRLTGELCPHGWAVGPPGEDGRLVTRGLYFPLGDPSIIEVVHLWWRRWKAG